ncbi:uncharacterized protein BX663DRAFT_541187 [Cokeromyces recurvatus]|uniref:uncharacterized protein n=1 Tax=Cokeromyces recurvatus TaxID=90255 RepID=UPI00221E5F0E|nr:uncharacterized protein BX663DRAFT_541187 [Cokeromyces recurvatus]KAI7905783.1 hypothetical protein BX663DRAFT_541187 [Cokeromyces recurvatus]
MKFLIIISCLGFLFLEKINAKPAEGCLRNYTVVETDSCTSVAAQFNLTEISFYTMNPGLHHSVKHDCDNLDTGKPYCVCMVEPCAIRTSIVSSNITKVNITANTTINNSVNTLSPSSSSDTKTLLTASTSMSNNTNIPLLASSTAVTHISQKNSLGTITKAMNGLITMSSLFISLYFL